MEPKHPTDMTIGQAFGGRLTEMTELHNLVENQVVTQEEAQKVLNYSFNKEQTWEIQDLLATMADYITLAERKRRRQEAANPVKSPFASDKIRDLADDTANDAYAAGARTYYAYLQRMKELLLLNGGFENFDAFKPYMRGSWSGIADKHGLPEVTRAAAEADYLRLAR